MFEQLKSLCIFLNIIIQKRYKIKKIKMNKKATIDQHKVQYLLIFFILITTSLGLSLRKQAHRLLSHQLYKDNLDVKNWYYGNIGPTQYRLRIFKITTSNGTIDICPIIAPFSSSDNAKCESCPLQTPLRNLQTNLCEKCPSGYVYSPNNGNCSLPLPVYDANTTTNSTVTISDQTPIMPKQVVPNTTVSYANSINITNNGYKPSGGSDWGGQTAALSGQASSNATTTTPVNTSNTTTSSNNTSGVSVNTTTVNTTNTSANVTNVTTNTTTVSPSSSNNTTMITNATNITNGNTNSVNKTSVNTTSVNTTSVNATSVNQTTVTPALNNTVVLPTVVLNNTSVQPITNASASTNTSTINTTVNSNITVPVISTNQTAQGSKQYNCSTTQPLYNEQTKKCETCPASYQYIIASNICLPQLWKMNSKATNFIQPSANYVNDLNQKLAFDHPTRVINECPSNMPYLVTQNNVIRCISCNASQYFVILTMKCIDGCPQGTLYNSSQNVCYPGMYATNPNTKNIASPTMKYDQWKQKLTKLQNATSNTVIFCPEQTPYAAKGVCIQCPSEKPYFNIDNEQCMACKEGKTFSDVDRRCKGLLSPQGSNQKYNNPSLMRMFVNLF